MIKVDVKNKCDKYLEIERVMYLPRVIRSIRAEDSKIDIS
jgi:hypothetical protein